MRGPKNRWTSDFKTNANLTPDLVNSNVIDVNIPKIVMFTLNEVLLKRGSYRVAFLLFRPKNYNCQPLKEISECSPPKTIKRDKSLSTLTVPTLH